jgi:hypothetical protein
MAKDILFDDVPEAQRAELLEANAIGTEEQLVRREFTESEMTFMKHQLSEVSIKQDTTAKEKAKIVKDFNDSIKIMEKERQKLLQGLKDTYYESEEKVYKMADFTEGTISFYDANGHKISTRRMYPEERQVNIGEELKKLPQPVKIKARA